ncbi:uncharacterized protein LOC121975888 isoform X2 [Zingiber officinale]|uniref:uncharacterized protein LOC121975888 isoform X2 n=1 Tax=Zingiber officinale TaxID=94328 RepID=UPI001C4AAD3E|nr:uncharacterized protein LOC121975888 isoform X2 [Zingiber officinale]XP_042383734.1 uncharacterized protein LOC121975888 isoform X2 [Zingiber officinale]XP_042383736.1 uncharacterized protein LOC121975888 isoform X2 [Zingiber officinale]
MGYPYKYLKKEKRVEYVSFVDPGHIPTYGVGEEGSKLSQHIAAQLRASNRDSICFIPYNTGNRDYAWQTIVTNGVKIYNASRGISKGPGFKQLAGIFKQNGVVECGYCVMRYMKEIVLDEDPQLERTFAALKIKQYYNQSQYDEVRSEWSEFVYFYVGA